MTEHQLIRYLIYKVYVLIPIFSELPMVAGSGGLGIVRLERLLETRVKKEKVYTAIKM